MLAKPTLMSLAQYGTSPQRIMSRLRSPALASSRTTGRGSVGATFQLGGKFGVGRSGARRDREDELDLADVGGKVGAATHAFAALAAAYVVAGIVQIPAQHHRGDHDRAEFDGRGQRGAVGRHPAGLGAEGDSCRGSIRVGVKIDAGASPFRGGRSAGRPRVARYTRSHGCTHLGLAEV